MSMSAVPSVEDAFRRLAIGDPEIVTAVAKRDTHDMPMNRMDARTEALLRLGALIALDAPSSSYRTVVAAALRSGARLEELFAVLIAVASEVGSARIVSAAPRIALAAGYDVEAALE